MVSSLREQAKASLLELSTVGRVEYEGGDVDQGAVYADFRVWASEGVSEGKMMSEIEDFVSNSFYFTISPTDSEEYTWVTARERI